MKTLFPRYGKWGIIWIRLCQKLCEINVSSFDVKCQMAVKMQLRNQRLNWEKTYSYVNCAHLHYIVVIVAALCSSFYFKDDSLLFENGSDI